MVSVIEGFHCIQNRVYRLHVAVSSWFVYSGFVYYCFVHSKFVYYCFVHSDKTV